MANEGQNKDGVEGGELLVTGCTNWAMLGRENKQKKTAGAGDHADDAKKFPNLTAPHRMQPMMGVPIVWVASGGTAAHCIALDADGRCFTWGRNEDGQLGHGDNVCRNNPTVVKGLANRKIVRASAGKGFTVVVTDLGHSFAFGANKHGQLGTGEIRKQMHTVPAPVNLTGEGGGVKEVSCGAEFTLWLTHDGRCLSAGLPQYGQLGHGTNHEVNLSHSSIKIAYEAQPLPKAIGLFVQRQRKIVRIAAGQNHAIAMDHEGHYYTWGCGGYGRLGHKNQDDQFYPQRLDVFIGPNAGDPATAVVAAGNTFSAGTGGQKVLYMWGRLKPTGDSIMYPKVYRELAGWHIRAMSCGPGTAYVASEACAISWGSGTTNGELGYGDSGAKSSANPKKIESLEGLHVLNLAGGAAHALFILRPGNLDSIPIFTPAPDSVDTSGKPSATNGRKRGAPDVKAEKPKAAGKKGKRAKEEEEEEEEEEKDEDEEEEEEEQSEDEEPVGTKGKGRGRGGSRGAAKGRGASAGGRGRGRGAAASAPKGKGSPASRGRGGRGRGASKGKAK